MKKRKEAVDRYSRMLEDFHTKQQPLPGLRTAERRCSLAEQLVDSIRRVEFVRTVHTRGVSASRTDPESELFDPVRGAIYQLDVGDYNEAAWLVFFSVHFGKNLRSGWRLAADVYRGDGNGRHWSWARTSASPEAFRRWLTRNQDSIRARGGHFGNHRKYTSLDANKDVGTGAAFSSYVDWIGPSRDHKVAFAATSSATPGDRFEALYHSLDAVTSFGRMAKFDYLTMLGKVGIAEIEPARTYLSGATGPLKGARLLLGRSRPVSALEKHLVELGAALGVGQQVMEDSICNWQKSPDAYRPFRG